MRNRHYNKDPKVIIAKFDSKCNETGVKITKGQECLYYPIGKSVFCLDSKQALQFRNCLADNSMGFNY